jgi:tRNA A-37 threonylcarbamoyl transferase component Bud32
VEKAFAKIHKLDVIHGDVRAANILVADDGSIWILDIEYAQVFSESEKKSLFDGEASEVKMLLHGIRSSRAKQRQ